jgi:septal ring factor EnvC (AmiA/AmiB activator)
VLLLLGISPQLLEQACTALDTYLGQQGLAARIRCVPPSTLHTSPQAMASHYSSLLAGDQCYDNELFFFSSSPEEQLAALSALRQTENRFRQDFPAQAALIAANQHLEKDLRSLQRKLTSTETELSNQRQFVEVLRSTHAAKELQDYYTNEYEILPLWFKRLGHLVKVLTGKRTFRSLFRDDVKKYKA